MSYLFEHHLHFQGINIFVLARDEHDRHANNVQIADLTSLCLALEVAVKQGNGQEESLVVALKVREHLDHPVHHASAEGRSDFVSFKVFTCVVTLFQFPQVEFDGFRVI